MSKDFRIKQLRTSQVIISGSAVGSQPSGLVYSSSAATNVDGGLHADLLTGVGTDVWYFVSGSKAGDSQRSEAVLFGGDVVVSGTLYAERQVVEVDYSQTSDLLLSGAIVLGDQGAGHATNGRAGLKDLINNNSGSLFVATGSLVFGSKMSGVYKESGLDPVDPIAGNGLGRQDLSSTEKSLHLDIHNLTGSLDNTSIAGGDLFAVADIDHATDETKKISLSEVATKMAGDGLAADAGSLSINAHELTSADMAATTDQIIFVDVGGGNPTRKAGITSLFMAATGSAKGIAYPADASGLTLDINSLASDSNAGNLADTIALADASDGNATKKITITQLKALVDTNTEYTAGDGLDLSVGNEFSIDRKAGGGLKIDSTELAIEPADFAGTGLEDDGSDNLRIAASAAGDGLKGGAGSALAVEPSDFAGTGLEDDGSDNLRIAASAAGNGLKGGGGVALSTDDSKVAHLTGSIFSGVVQTDNALTAAFGIHVDEYIRHKDDADTFLRFQADQISLNAGGISAINIIEDAANSVISVNDAANSNMDFKVRSLNKDKLIFVDAGLDYVSIGDPSQVKQDMHLFVSGWSGGAQEAHQQGVTAFLGDVVVSGSLLDANHSAIDKTSFKQNGTFGAGTANAPSATGTDSVAIGLRALASGNYSLAIGSSENNNTDATATHSLAIGGDDATASGAYAAAMGGSANTAAGQYSVAMGRSSTATGDYSVAIGDTLETYDARTTIFGSSTAAASAKTLLSSSLTVDQATTLTGDVTLGDSADLIVPTYIKHKSDLNTNIQFNLDRIRFNTNGITKSDFTSDQVLIMSGGASGDVDPAAAQDVSFMVSGSLGSRGTTTRGTALFTGDVHISGSLSGPSSYELTDDTVRMFRDGSDLKFDDGNNTVKTLSQLATVGISDESTFFQGVHGGSNNSKTATSASVSFAGTQGSTYYTENVGSDVYLYVSGGLRSDNAAFGRTTTVFGGAAVFSGSADYLGDVSFTAISAASVTGSQSVTTALIADTAGNPVLAVANQKIATGLGVAPPDANSAFFTLQKNSATQAGTSNTNADFQLLLKNTDDGDNSFSGIAFDSGNETDPDSIGAAIRGERDSTAGSDMTLHDMNLTFATNDAGDAGLTERMRITHDGKVGIGIATPSRALDVNGDIHVRGGDILFANNQNASITIADVAGTNVTGKDITISGGPSTGNAAGGGIKFNLAQAGSSGTSVNAASTTVLSLSPTDGSATFAGNVTLPSDGDIKNADGNTVLTVRGDSNGNGVQIPGGDLELNQSAAATIIIGDDSDGNDRSISFGHATLKSRIGIDDSGDVFAINTDQDFEATNDFAIDASGNVTIGNGNLVIDGGEIRGPTDGQLKMYADTNVCINIDVDGSGTDALFKVQTNSQTTKFEINESGNVQADGDLDIDGTGTSDFAGSVQINGNLELTDRIRHVGDTDTQIRFLNTGKISFETATGGMLLIDGNSSQKAVILNNGAADIDFNVKGDNDANLIYADASTDRVGIGTDAPATELHIVGDLTVQDGSSSDVIGKLYASSDDGILDIYQDNVVKARINGNGASFIDGGDLSIGEQLTVVKGIPNSTSVLCNSSVDGSEDRFFKIATVDTNILHQRQLKTTILVTMAGPEVSNSFDADDTFLLHVEFAASNASPYYQEEGTFIRVDTVSGQTDLEGFDPATDVVMTFDNTALPTQVDLYIKSKESHRSIYTSILGGTTSQLATGSQYAIEGFRLLSGQTPAAAITSLGTNIFGTWVSKYYSAINLNGGLLFKPAYASVKLSSDTDANVNEFNPFDTDENGSPTEMCTATGVTFTSSNGRFTIGEAGAYEISANIFLNGSQHSANLGAFKLEKNGSSDILTANPDVSTGADTVELNLNGIFDLAASDYIEFKIDSMNALTSHLTVMQGTTLTIKRVG